MLNVGNQAEAGYQGHLAREVGKLRFYMGDLLFHLGSYEQRHVLPGLVPANGL